VTRWTGTNDVSPATPPTLLAFALVAGSLVGCNTTGRPLPELVREINATFHQGDSVLPGDELEVRFPYTPEWTHSATVSPTGMASFLELDDIPVGGLTVEAIDEVLTQGYTAILEMPDLTVRVKTPAPRTAAILGEVREPGNYAVRDHYTLLQLLADSEGYLKRSADLDALLLLRWIPDLQQVRAWYIDADPEHWVCAEPLYIQPLDVVFIPNKPIDKINIFVDQYLRLMLPFPYLYVPTVSY
jgi:protein involved in polysaccharide export with SLBB domain